MNSTTKKSWPREELSSGEIWQNARKRSQAGASMNLKSRSRIFLVILSLTWLMASAVGMLLLADYDSKPGHPARPPRQWPSGVSLARNASKPTVLMFLHPRCPCSRASLSELARLAHGERDRLDVSVVFAQPSNVTAEWSQTELWKNAVANGDLHVAIDTDGSLTEQFGAKTSGQVLVYDCKGALRFEGGITPGRGHPGDSFGGSMVREIAAGQTADLPAHCATFGCALSANSVPDDADRSPLK